MINPSLRNRAYNWVRRPVDLNTSLLILSFGRQQRAKEFSYKYSSKRWVNRIQLSADMNSARAYKKLNAPAGT